MRHHSSSRANSQPRAAASAISERTSMCPGHMALEPRVRVNSSGMYTTIWARRKSTSVLMKTRVSWPVKNRQMIMAFEFSWKSWLSQLYSSLGGDHWIRNDGWTEAALLYGEDPWQVGIDYCNWYGVVCNNNTWIIKTNLSANNLTGRIVWNKGSADLLSRFDQA